MAGDWLKMTHALPEKPEVLAISGKTGLNRFEVVGRLFILWRWFDNNTIDGNAAGVTSVTLNDCLFGYGDATAFVSAVVAAKWLTETTEGISVVKFDEHTSESAKQRAQTAKRVAKSKKNAKANAEDDDEVTPEALPGALPREEKNKNKYPPTPLDEIVELYHQHLPTLPQVKLKTEKRDKACREFWRWIFDSRKSDGEPRAQTADQALTWVAGYFERASTNDFLLGNRPTRGHENWKADFDFLLTERGRKHVIEKTQEAA